MPSSRFELLNRVKTVEREYIAVRFAVDFLLNSLHTDSSVLDAQIQVRDIKAASVQLEGTYLIRLFAEFETCLRKFWTVARNTEPPGRALDLINGVGANRRIPNDRIQAAHSVREYRNALIHERDEPADPVRLGDARSYLCSFLGFLPPRF